MRRLFTFLLSTLVCLIALSSLAYAGFPSSSSTTSTTTSSSPNSSNNTNGGNTFGSQVQQQTTQAMQVFQNVNYQKLSAAQNQDEFSSDDSNPPDPSHLFNIFSGS